MDIGIHIRAMVASRLAALELLTQQGEMKYHKELVPGVTMEETTKNPLAGKKIADIFPIWVKLACNCITAYEDIPDFPDTDAPCPHGNYFVKYDLPSKL